MPILKSDGQLVSRRRFGSSTQTKKPQRKRQKTKFSKGHSVPEWKARYVHDMITAKSLRRILKED